MSNQGGSSEAAKAGWCSPNVQILAGLVAVWYVSGAATIVTTKELMNIHRLPFLWGCTQFLCSYAFSCLYLRLASVERKASSGTFQQIGATAFFYAMGFVSTNFSLLYVTAPFVELVRAMESITTMFLGHFFLTERPSLRCLFTLIPTCGGIALSCNNTEHFSIIGFIALCGSNFFFSARSVAARYLQQSSSTKLEPVNLFAEVSLYGLLVLVPITVIAESSVILKTAQGYGLGGETGTYNPDPQQYAQLQHLLVMVLTNGLAFAICNALSFVVLARTDLLTHCVLNVLRRVVAIFTGSVYFHVPLNAANISGVTISIGGVLLYTYFKYADRQA